MKCPRCGLVVTDQVPRCRGCGFGLSDLDRRAGPLPERAGLVNDFAELLSSDERAALEEELQRLREALGGEIVVVIVPSAGAVRPAEYAFWLYNRWAVGGPGHAGVLLLLALADRRIESEVGYGWEPVLTDAESGAVLDECVVPLLREGRFAEGLRAGIERLAAILEAGIRQLPPGGTP